MSLLSPTLAGNQLLICDFLQAAYTSGNHGQAVAWASRMAGLPCTVVLPNNTATIKYNAIKGYGAEVVRCEPTPRDR